MRFLPRGAPFPIGSAAPDLRPEGGRRGPRSRVIVREIATRGGGAPVVSVVVRTVVGMRSQRHVCIWFDDADGVELLCACGTRAVAVVDEETGELVVVATVEEPAQLAVSA